MGLPDYESAAWKAAKTAVAAGQHSVGAISEGQKADGGKPLIALVPSEAIEEIARAFTFGAEKYAANNWRKGFGWTRVASALLRHVHAWLRGEEADPESGLSHLAHAGACLCFLLTFEKTGTGTDDRYRPINP